MRSLEQELIARAKAEVGGTAELIAVWIRPFSRYANLMRSHEASIFPEAKEVSIDDESRSLFFALIDLRSDPSIVIGATLCGAVPPDGGVQYEPQENTVTSSGFIFIDQLIDLGNFSLSGFTSYLESIGIAPHRSMSVETIYRIGAKVAPWKGLSVTDVAFSCFFRSLQRGGGTLGRSAVLATVNEAAISVFKRFGLRFEYLMGRSDFFTPEAELGRMSVPIVMVYDQYAEDLFSSVTISIAECTL